MKKSEALPAGIYNLIFKNVLEGIYLITSENRYITANHALAGILGYESTTALLKDMTDKGHKLYVKPERQAKFLRLLQENDSISGFESQVCRKDGSRIWISENVRAVRNGKGKILYCLGTVEDITAKKQAEEALRQSEANLRMQLRKSEENREGYAEMLDDVCNAYDKMDELFLSFVETIVHALDERCKWMKGHSERVASYSMAIAKAIGVKQEEMRNLRIAALLHDIGRLCSNDSLFEKQGLSNEDYELIKRHPLQGATILDGIGDLKDIIPLIRHHHERTDGKGYPDGLKGEEIPLCARILHLAESYDSMTADRPYRQAPGKDFAFSELKRCNNTQFDPKVAEAALEVL
jgi:PAS domain S-box-containing protein/putative nucleotidyltransferase with HDIG domain